MKTAFICLLACIGIGYAIHSRWSPELPPERGPSGFIAVDMPDDADRDTVYVFAPEHSGCLPYGEDNSATRADLIEAELDKRRIPYVRIQSFHASGSTDPDDAYRRRMHENTRSVLDGDFPKVFMAGFGKSDPTAKDVVADYAWIRTHRGATASR